MRIILNQNDKILARIFIASIVLICFSRLMAQPHKGHAHNDYVHKKPLFDALNNGFRSIEIDVWLNEGKLAVSHNRFRLSQKPNIDELYFQPLFNLIRKNKGKSPYDSLPIILLIDIKNQPEAAYKRLKEYLQPYDTYLCKWKGDSLVSSGSVALLISGYTPRKQIMEDSIRIANIDGRIQDTVQQISISIVPNISLPWSHYFVWNGIGNMPENELEKLRKIVAAVHKYGRTIRFWGAPDHFNAWKTLLREGVDWINTDNLKAFAQFYGSQK
ncbi:MAG: hypothetical protein RMJ53_05620 [Chitinophagales bacterium]|nr:hypothetical protein [Chitinophagales bacterium]MDW8273689.1 hypothetical protein [Chitinophagales bacterium]